MMLDSYLVNTEKRKTFFTTLNLNAPCMQNIAEIYQKIRVEKEREFHHVPLPSYKSNHIAKIKYY